MRLIKVTEKIPLIIFDTNKEAALTLCRFQEHYESPNVKFRESPFTLRQFKNWYIKENGEFSYPEDWGGFNFPSSIVDKFKKGMFNPLFKREENFIKSIKGFKSPFYVIATFQEGNEDIELFLKHEIAHALFYTSPTYRKNALNIIKEFKEWELNMLKSTLEHGYGENTIVDEIHAYLSTDDMCHWMGEEEQRMLTKRKKLVRLLKENFEDTLINKKIDVKKVAEEIVKG